MRDTACKSYCHGSFARGVLFWLECPKGDLQESRRAVKMPLEAAAKSLPSSNIKSHKAKYVAVLTGVAVWA